VPLHPSSCQHHTSYCPFSPSSGSRGSYSQLPSGLTCSTSAHPKERDVWQVGRLLVSRHASHVFVAHQYCALDVHQDRSTQRPCVCICLGARACSSPLIRKPISHFLARLLTHPPLPLPLPFPAFLMRDFILDWLCRPIEHPIFRTAGNQH